MNHQIMSRRSSFCPYFAKFTHRCDTKRGFHVTLHKWIVYGGRRKRPAEKRLILCRTVPVSGNYTPFSGPSDMFSGDLVMDGPEKGEYLADK